MTVRDFDGASAGPATPVALNGLTSTQFPISRVTGMLFWNGRPYYTLTSDGRNWSTVSGMTMASGRLIYATTGILSSITFTGGIPTGTATVHNTGTWQSRGLFVLNLPT